MNDLTKPEARSSRVNAGGTAVVVLVTLVSLGLCVGWVVLLTSDVLVAHKLARPEFDEYGMAAAYFAVFATAGASIALVFKLLVRQHKPD